VAPEKFVYCFLNALTALSAELEGRHYGGGVLELVPSEIEKVLVPVPHRVRPNLGKLDELVRKQSAQIVLARQSREILGGIGISRSAQETLFSAWMRLKNRRQRTPEPVEGEQDAA
jgi:hypothetical protein